MTTPIGYSWPNNLLIDFLTTQTLPPLHIRKHAFARSSFSPTEITPATSYYWRQSAPPGGSQTPPPPRPSRGPTDLTSSHWFAIRYETYSTVSNLRIHVPFARVLSQRLCAWGQVHCWTLTLNQPLTHKCIQSLHKSIRIYMGVIILGANTLYIL